MKLSSAQIQECLSPYQREFHLANTFEYSPTTNSSVATICFDRYPFTRRDTRYTSINLINLAVEQLMLLQLDCEAQIGTLPISPLSADEYRTKVADGNWLTPRLSTNVSTPVPRNTPLLVRSYTERRRIHTTNLYVKFHSSSKNFFHASGMVVFVSQLPESCIDAKATEAPPAGQSGNHSSHCSANGSGGTDSSALGTATLASRTNF